MSPLRASPRRLGLTQPLYSGSRVKRPHFRNPARDANVRQHDAANLQTVSVAMEQTTETSPRSRGAALALCLLIGWLGAHRFYVGKTGTGVLMLCTFGGFGLWWLYDVILISAGSFRDADGRRVTNWTEGEVPGLTPRAGTDPRVELVLNELDVTRSEVAELAERVDFLERMLTQVRQRASLPQQ